MINADDVFQWLQADNPSAGDREVMDRVVGAVVAKIGRRYSAPLIEPDEDWLQAHIMAAASLWRRRDTPGGYQTGEFGAIRVGRLDPDVVEMLVPFIDWSKAFY